MRDQGPMQFACRCAFVAALLGTFVMALLPNPPTPPVVTNDKIQHVITFVALMILAMAGWSETQKWKLAGGLLAAGVLIEIFQAIPALNRSSSLLDIAADAAGILIGLAVVSVARLATRA